MAAKDFYFALSTKTVKAGRVTFVIRNAQPRSARLRDRRTSLEDDRPGKTTTLIVALKPGRYLYRCTVDSHAELGMKGFLRVTPRRLIPLMKEQR